MGFFYVQNVAFFQIVAILEAKVFVLGVNLLLFAKLTQKIYPTKLVVQL